MIRGKKTVISYVRVSTKKQGDSGLGLESQRATITEYAKAENCKVLAEYVEVESGKKSDRPQFQKALAHAKRSNSVLLIAKLDRLARNVHFTSGLLESKVEFMALDCPHANKFTIHILAAVAEHEAEAISLRTKAALAAYKARGGQLGGSRPECRNLTPEGRKAGIERSVQVRREAAAEASSHIGPMALKLRDSGQTLQQIADHLNESGERTRTGKLWSPKQVSRIIERAKANA